MKVGYIKEIGHELKMKVDGGRCVHILTAFIYNEAEKLRRMVGYSTENRRRMNGVIHSDIDDKTNCNVNYNEISNKMISLDVDPSTGDLVVLGQMYSDEGETAAIIIRTAIDSDNVKRESVLLYPESIYTKAQELCDITCSPDGTVYICGGVVSNGRQRPLISKLKYDDLYDKDALSISAISQNKLNTDGIMTHIKVTEDGTILGIVKEGKGYGVLRLSKDLDIIGDIVVANKRGNADFKLNDLIEVDDVIHGVGECSGENGSLPYLVIFNKALTKHKAKVLDEAVIRLVRLEYVDPTNLIAYGHADDKPTATIVVPIEIDSSTANFDEDVSNVTVH